MLIHAYQIFLICHGDREFKQKFFKIVCLIEIFLYYDPVVVPLSFVRPFLHGTVCHCHTQNKCMIRSKNGEAIFQCG